NLMKPYLARNFGVIGCTTLDEFRFIEKDPALDRRFQKLIINEPSTEDTISILRGVKASYEIYHKVTIKDSAIISAVKMTDRYITDKFLPDKALSILDEACANLRVALDSKPDEIYDLEQKLIQIKIELNSLIEENDSDSINRKNELAEEYVNLENELLDLTLSWEQDKELVDKIVELQESREKCKQDIDSLI
ncbi:type VI secretion system ATPase TssH, partial [Sutterella wadsworthensis]